MSYDPTETTRELERLSREHSELYEALAELADLMDATKDGEYKPDSFTTQPARTLLKRLDP